MNTLADHLAMQRDRASTGEAVALAQRDQEAQAREAAFNAIFALIKDGTVPAARADTLSETIPGFKQWSAMKDQPLPPTPTAAPASRAARRAS